MISLQNYSTYSIKSGVMEPKKWAKRAAELGYESLALTDKQTLAGLLEFQKDCQKEGVKPILGAEFLVTDDVDIRDKAKKENVQGVVLLYAMNDKGLENLIALNNFSTDKERGFYYRERIDPDVMDQYSEGLACISPVEDGYGRDVAPNSIELENQDRLDRLQEIFGADFYVGINPVSDLKTAKFRNRSVLGMYQPIFTFNCHYPEASQAHLYDIVRRMDGDNRKMSKNLPRSVSNGHLPHEDEVFENMIDVAQEGEYEDNLFRDCMENMQRLSDSCTAEIETGTYHMPEMETETGSVKGDLLKYIGEGIQHKLCPDVTFKNGQLESIEELEGLREQFENTYAHEHAAKGEVEDGEPREEFEYWLHPLDEYIDRVKYEFKIIEQLGYLDYFHIIHYLCAYIDSKGLGRGYARGSAAGSLVSYLLNITRVDPLRHSLIFERFLNPDRNDLPDIDLDFSVEARKEIKQHVRDKWGEERVCNIGAYGRLKTVSAIKAVARSNNYKIPDNNGEEVQYSFGRLTNLLSNTYAKATERGRKELESRMEGNTDFQDFVSKHYEWIESVVMPLQEMVVNTQIHAAGTLITKDVIDKCVPVYEHKNGTRVTQWKDRDCESAGNPKFDFLTVEGVNVVSFAKKLIKQRRDIDVPPVEEISLDDPETMKVFTEVKTRGIFQFRTYSQRKYFQTLRPTKFDELVAAVALVRPGPLGADAHTHYADIKHGRKEPEYPHEDLKDTLGETHGLIVYQEQIMKIVQKIGGLTPSQADYVRKACGKKKIKAMKKWQSVFMEGGVENGYDEDLLKTLWSNIVEFAEYGFNKSHAVAYTLLSYYQAYIKARYKVEFWPAVLKYSDEGKEDSSPQSLKHLVKSYGIDIVYPTIYGFAPDFEPAGEDNQIYWPLKAIKGVGDTVAEELSKGGRRGFDSIEQMLESVDKRRVHKGVVGKLIKAGFFDPIAEPWEVAKIYFDIRKENGRRDDGIPYDLDHKNRFRWQQYKNDAYGMIVKPWKEVAPFHPNVKSYTDDQVNKLPDDKSMFVGGYVESVRTKQTQNGGWYARMILVDEGEKHTVMMWPGFWEYNDKLDRPDENGQIHRPFKGQLVELTGRKDSWNGRNQIVLNSPKSYCRVIWDEMELD